MSLIKISLLYEKYQHISTNKTQPEKQETA
jgi:hypothetical protein